MQTLKSRNPYVSERVHTYLYFSCDEHRKKKKHVKVSAWDHVFLGPFWIDNSIAIS